MNDEGIEILKFFIHTKRSFRIGKKEICLNLTWDGHNWYGEIPRADVTMVLSRLKVWDSGDGYKLQCESLGMIPMVVSLDRYDSLMVIG